MATEKRLIDANVPTNADRIRSMTDEELSMIMVQLADLDDRIHYCQNFRSAKRCWILRPEFLPRCVLGARWHG